MFFVIQPALIIKTTHSQGQKMALFQWVFTSMEGFALILRFPHIRTLHAPSSRHAATSAHAAVPAARSSARQIISDGTRVNTTVTQLLKPTTALLNPLPLCQRELSKLTKQSHGQSLNLVSGHCHEASALRCFAALPRTKHVLLQQPGVTEQPLYLHPSLHSKRACCLPTCKAALLTQLLTAPTHLPQPGLLQSQ